MEIIIVIFLSTIIASLVLIFVCGQVGVFLACVFSSLTLPYCYLALRGIGSPNGVSYKMSLVSYSQTALIVFLYCLLTYYGFYLLKILLLNKEIPVIQSKVWLGFLLIVVGAHVTKSIYKGANNHNFYITIGYNEESGIQENDIVVFVKKGNKKN